MYLEEMSLSCYRLAVPNPSADQVRTYKARGLQVAFIGKAQKDENVRVGVAKGKYQLVYIVLKQWY